MLGSFLQAYRPRAKVKEVQKPKFYWFDPGVLNAAAGAFDQPMPKDWSGVLLEHWIHHEIKSYLDYKGIKGTLGFCENFFNLPQDEVYDNSPALTLEEDFWNAFQNSQYQAIDGLDHVYMNDIYDLYPRSSMTHARSGFLNAWKFLSDQEGVILL